MRTLIKTKDFRACIALLLLFGGGVGLVHWLHLRVNLTDSLPRGIYRETSEEIRRGSYVAECLPDDLARFAVRRGWLGKGSCANGTNPILKQVVAIAGDEVTIDNAYVAVNGMVLLRTASLKLDSQGRWIPAIPRGTFTLKAGEVFLLATNIPNSWDSRYTGPARRENIIATARPVWIEEAE